MEAYVGFCELILRLILDDLPRTKTSLRFLLMQWQAEQNLPSYTYYSEVEGRTDGVHLIRPSYRQFNHLLSHWAKRKIYFPGKDGFDHKPSAAGLMTRFVVRGLP